MKSFPVIYEEDENGGFVVSCPVLEGCYSQGDTLKEATNNIKEAIELCLEELDDNKRPNNVFFSQVVL